MDGLGSAKDCKGVLIFPLTSVSLVQTMSGTIPDCVWLMTNLKMLNLAGNGLSGRIRRNVSLPSLWNLTLSHNYLSGVIPLWLQTKNMSHLDLSHNKLTGDVGGFMRQMDWDLSSDESLERSLNLEVNRLSGELSDSLKIFSKLNILSGNLFGCDYLPTNDEKSEWWSCGSEEYDQSIWLMVGLLSLILLSIICYSFCRLVSLSLLHDRDEPPAEDNSKSLDWLRRGLADSQKLIQSAGYFRDCIDSPAVSFGFLLTNLMKAVCLLTIISILFSLPIYVLKELDQHQEDVEYVTHSQMYNWLWTMAFLSGHIPAALFFLLGLVCLMLFTFILNLLGKQQETDTCAALSLPPSSDYSLIVTVGTIFLVNIIVVGTVNGLYVVSTLQDISSDIRIWIQLSVGLFSFLWSVIVLRSKILSSTIKESKYGVWLFVCLNVMNNVVIPCLATALSSPSCYQVR
jgi:hypothetical protein